MLTRALVAFAAAASMFAQGPPVNRLRIAEAQYIPLRPTTPLPQAAGQVAAFDPAMRTILSLEQSAALRHPAAGACPVQSKASGRRAKR